jgi:acetyltransferase-like isoleucine patch superfamily enzyme
MAAATIDAEEVILGTGTVIHPSAVLCGPDGGRAKRIELGDHCYIGEGVQIRCPDFRLGDFGKIHHHTNVHGYLPCSIGHNAWIGQFTIIDSIGGTTIGDNCGIGAQSQLWSHIKYGDTLEGCRFLGEKPLTIGKDVWFVGHCIVSPIVAGDKAMAMVGSVVTRDMEANHAYGGSPAVDLTAKVGPPFAEVALADKVARLRELLAEANAVAKIDTRTLRVAATAAEVTDDESSWFVVDTRTYTKRRTPAEVAFMKFLLPARAKFTPRPTGT